MAKSDALQKCYDLLCAIEKSSRAFGIAELAQVTGWKETTARTYINKKWSHFITKTSDRTFAVKGVSSLGIDGFKRIHSQKLDVSNEPLRPRFTSPVDTLVDKSRDAVLLGVTVFNNPMLKFRSHGFIVQMMIGWLSLFHAIFEKRGLQYYYVDKNGKPIEIDGDLKAWELNECIKEYWKDQNDSVRANLDFFIKLRNKIEHRYLPALDASISGRCQSLLLNYERMLVEHFGKYFSLNTSLAISLQLTQLSESAEREARKELTSKNYNIVSKFMTEYDAALPADISKSQDYQIRVFMVPKIGNHSTSSDIAVEYVRYDPNDPEAMKNYEHLIAFIKEKPSTESIFKRRPTHVMNTVSQRLGKPFLISHHTNAWKHFKVRPKGKTDRSPCNKKYCGWVEGHEDYLYSDDWIDFLVKELSNEDTYKKIISFKDKT